MTTEIKDMSKTALMAEALMLQNVSDVLLDMSYHDDGADSKCRIDGLYNKIANHWGYDPTGSPIERLLWAQILFMVDGYKDVEVLDGPEESYLETWAWVSPQYSIGKYRADFLFSVIGTDPDQRQLLVVECDGHDFHERTKEQARHDKARDRYFTKHGIKVLHFTGSEIYADVGRCCEDIEYVVGDMLEDTLEAQGHITRSKRKMA